MKRKRVCQSLWAAALVVLSAGCVKEPYPGGGTGGSSGFTLTAVAESMSPEGVITRASDPKTAAECEIRTLHVFLFGPDGNYLGTREGHRIFQGYQQIGSPTLHIDAGGFSDPAAAASATVYVVANVEPGTFGAISAEGYPEKIRNKADFDAFYYQPTRREDLSELPEAGMPMFGMDTLDLTQADGSVVVELKALMARVDFSFRVEAPGGTIGGAPFAGSDRVRSQECPDKGAVCAFGGRCGEQPRCRWRWTGRCDDFQGGVYRPFYRPFAQPAGRSGVLVLCV